MPQSSTQTGNDLAILEEQLREELWRLFHDVNCWHLESRQYEWQRAYFDTYEISEGGELKLSFHIVGNVTAGEGHLSNLTHEDLSRARELVNRIVELKKSDGSDDWRFGDRDD